MKKRELIFLIAIVLASCGNVFKSDVTSETPSIVPDTATSDLIVWPMPESNASVTFLPDEFDDIKFIVLDQQSKALIAGVDQFLISSGTITIADNLKTERIVQFDTLGHYIRQIGAKGKADGEYIAPGCITLSDSGEIWLADRGARKLLVYNSSGQFIRDLTGITTPMEMAFKDSVLIGSFPGYFADMPFRLKWFDNDGDELDTAMPYITSRPMVAGRLQKNEIGDVMFAQKFNDTIYSIGVKSLKPVVKMNMNDVNLTEEFIERTADLTTKEFQRELFNNKEIVNYLDYVNFGSNWAVRQQKGFNSTLSLITKNSSKRKDYKIAEMKGNSFDDIEMYIPEWFVGCFDGYLVGYIDPDTFNYLDPGLKEKYLNAIMSNSATPIEDKNDIIDSRNLILSLYRFRTPENEK